MVNDREEFANRERFPYADEIRIVDFDNVADQIEVNQSAYIVIITRGHQYDEKVLKAFIESKAPTLG